MSVSLKSLSLLLLFFANLLTAQPDTLQWSKLNVPSVGKLNYIDANYVYDFELFDVDRDGEEEVVIIRSDRDYPLQIAAKEIHRDSYAILPRPLHLNHTWDERRWQRLHPLKHHPIYKFMIYDLTEDAGWLKFYDRELTLRDSIRTIRGYSQFAGREWNGNLFHLYMRDINGDLRPDLVFNINTASDGQPRVILAYDLFTKEKILHLKFAPMIQDFSIVDMDGDGDVEIITELIGAGDGPFFGPFKRNESYIAIFDHQGHPIKSWEHAGPATYVSKYLIDFNQDGFTDLIATYRALAETDLPSRLEIIDGADFSIKASMLDHNDIGGFCNVLWVDIQSDSVFNIVVSNQSHQVRRLAYQPSQNRIEEICIVTDMEQVVDAKHIDPYYHDDINNDGVEEVLFLDWQNDWVWIAKPDLTLLAKIPIEMDNQPSLRVLNSSTQETREYLLYANHNLFRLAIDVDEAFPPAALTWHWNGRQIRCSRNCAVMLIVAFILLIGLAITVLLRQRGMIHHSALFHSERISAFLLDSDARFKWANSRFLELTETALKDIRNSQFQDALNKPHLSPLSSQVALFIRTQKTLLHKEITFGLPGRPMSMALELHRMRNHMIQGMLIDLTETTQTERLRVWSAMAQRVIHKTKTPLGTILLVIQRLQKAYRKESPRESETYDRYVDKAVFEIERVRQDINAFMRIARLHEAAPKKEELNLWMTQFIRNYKKHVPEGVMIHWQRESEMLPVMIDSDQLTEAFMNLLDNAVAAVKGNGLVRIGCQKEAHPLSQFGSREMVLIEVMDNGCGITEDGLSQLFTPGYTTREEGSGLGLMIAKAIIIQHEGDIDIHSTHEIGTTVIVRLPLCSDNELKEDDEDA